MRFIKNTYVINIEKLHPHFYDFHSSKKEMPLPLLSLNGQPFPFDGFSIPTKLFPNPQTQEMIFDFNERKKFRTRLSLTIVEYTTKRDRPVAFLFPNGDVYYINAKPNHAIKKDIMYQQNMRNQLIAEKTKEKRR